MPIALTLMMLLHPPAEGCASTYTVGPAFAPVVDGAVGVPTDAGIPVFAGWTVVIVPDDGGPALEPARYVYPLEWTSYVSYAYPSEPLRPNTGYTVYAESTVYDLGEEAHFTTGVGPYRDNEPSVEIVDLVQGTIEDGMVNGGCYGAVEGEVRQVELDFVTKRVVRDPWAMVYVSRNDLDSFKLKHSAVYRWLAEWPAPWSLREVISSRGAPDLDCLDVGLVRSDGRTQIDRACDPVTDTEERGCNQSGTVPGSGAFWLMGLLAAYRRRCKESDLWPPRLRTNQRVSR